MGVTLAYLIARKESVKTESPAMPNAMRRSHLGVVQRHLDLLVGVFIVHVVNDVEGIHVQSASQARYFSTAAMTFS